MQALPVLVVFLVAEISCNCIERSFVNAEVTVCAKSCLPQQKVDECVNGNAFASDVAEVYLNTNVRKLRRGAFIDMPHLKGIYATNIGVEIIFPGAFANLPEVEVGDLSSNRIEDVVLGVFNDMSFDSLILSSNNISYIDQGAFSNMRRLRTVLLNKNDLGEFSKHWFVNSTVLEVLDLSYNKISALEARSFYSLPNLLHLDLSFNQIVEIGLGSFANVKQLNFLDLTGNNLTEINPNVFDKGITVKELRFPLNRLTFLHQELFGERNIQAVSLHSNPWNCPALKNVMKWTSMYVVTILEPKSDDRIKYDNTSPVCFCPVQTDPSQCAL